MGRPCTRAHSPVHGHLDRHPLQPCDPQILPAPVRSRQTQKGRPHRGHAQTAHHTQCHDQSPETLDRRPFSLAGDLTSNTVALGGKWHKTRRLDPGALWARVGRHWLVLAMATLLAVAYGTRREDAEARHRAPGRLRRQDPAARPTGSSAPTGPFCPHTAADSRPRRA